MIGAIPLSIARAMDDPNEGDGVLKYYKCGCLGYTYTLTGCETMRHAQAYLRDTQRRITMLSDQYDRARKVKSQFILACVRGNVAEAWWLVKTMKEEEREANLDEGMYYACLEGQLEMAKELIRMGVHDMDNVLTAAAEGGSIECIELALEYGATDLNRALSAACRADQDDVVRLMAAEGATECYICSNPVAMHPVGYSDDSGVRDPRANGDCPHCGGNASRVYMSLQWLDYRHRRLASLD